MQWRNSRQRYGFVAVILHWLLAVALLGLFALGWWMVDLDYYHAWYQRAPDLHKSIGVLASILMLLRFMWRCINVSPAAAESLSALEHRIAVLGQYGFYLLVLCLFVSGYLIVTAEGRGLVVFDMFTLPALPIHPPNQEDVAGIVHEYLAWFFLVLALLHGVAALRHHFIERDRTLLKMLGL